MREGARYRFTVDPFGLRHLDVLVREGHPVERIAQVHCIDPGVIRRDRAMLALSDLLHEHRAAELLAKHGRTP